VLSHGSGSHGFSVESPRTAKPLDAAVVILQDPHDIEAAFMARQFVQCTLPHMNPAMFPHGRGRNGKFDARYQPGSDIEGKSFGFPYGTIARLLLFWMNTETVKTKSRRLELGHNLSDFMRWS
jgi:Plasmid encoded RepA protein